MAQKESWALAYLYLAVGLVLVLFAFPSAYAGVVLYDHALGNAFSSLGMAIELRALLTLPLAFGVGSIGLWLWRSQARSLRITEDMSEADRMPGFRAWILVLYVFLAFAFEAVALLAGFTIFGLLSLALVFGFVGSDYPLTLTKDFLFIFGILLDLALCVLHLTTTFRMVMFHWRLLGGVPLGRFGGG